MKNAEYYQFARQYLMGGVSSSFRYNPFTARPIYLSKAEGAYIHDLEGNRFIDFFMGHGIRSLKIPVPGQHPIQFLNSVPLF